MSAPHPDALKGMSAPATTPKPRIEGEQDNVLPNMGSQSPDHTTAQATQPKELIFNPVEAASLEHTVEATQPKIQVADSGEVASLEPRQSPGETPVPQSQSPASSSITEGFKGSPSRETESRADDTGERDGEKKGEESMAGMEEDESKEPEARGGSDAKAEVEDEEAQDVMKIAREYLVNHLLPNLFLCLCVVAGSAPVFLAGLVHLTERSFYNVVLAGIVLGMTVMGVWSMMAQLRSTRWRMQAKKMATTGIPEYQSLKAIFSPKRVPDWIVFTEYDKAEWLNKVLLKLWPHINKAASALVKEQLQPILDTYKMGSITSLHVHGFTLGNIPPRITGVKLTPGKDKLVLEAKVDWRSKPEQKLTLKIKTIGPDFKVQVKRLRTYGVLYMVFQPLIEDIPGFGALLFSLREEPEVDFDIEFLGGDIMALPGIDKMIDGIIRTALIDMLVWPSRLVFPVGPGDYRELQLHPVGQLYVILHEAKDLMNTDVLGKTDAFAFVYVRQKKATMKRSSTKQNTLNPVWNEGFYIEVEDPEMQYLTVQIMDDEKVEKSELVGSARFPISQLKEGVTWDGWLELKANPKRENEGRTRGRVHVQLIYRSYPPEVIEEKLPKKALTGDVDEESSQHEDKGKDDAKSPRRLKTMVGKPFRMVRSLFHHESNSPAEKAGTTEDNKESTE